MPLLLASQHVEDGTKWTSFCRWHFQTHALDGKVFHSNITVFPDGSIDIMSSVVQVLVLCQTNVITWINWIRIDFFLTQQLGLNPGCWLIIKLASILQSHIYPLDSACLSIGTFTLTSRCCHWNCTKPLLGEYRGVYCLLYIPGKVYHLHYDVIIKKYFQHYWPFMSPHEGPTMWYIDVPFCVSLNKLLNK